MFEVSVFLATCGKNNFTLSSYTLSRKEFCVSRLIVARLKSRERFLGICLVKTFPKRLLLFGGKLNKM